MRILAPLLLLLGCTPSGPVVIDTDTDDTDVDTSLRLAVPCEDSPGAVYAGSDTTDAPPPGTLVGCAPLEAISEPALREDLADLDEVVVRSGYARHLIGYRSTRGVGVPAHATASLLVPDDPPDGPVPLVVVVHGTLGLADACAPSRQEPGGLEAAVLPWVAAGIPVVAPDLAGLGTLRIPGFGHVPDTAPSVLDAARAGLLALPPEAVSGEVIVLGHGVGAQAALGAQALAGSYAPEIDLAGVIAAGGGLPLTDPTPSWRLASRSIDGADGVDRAAFLLGLQADAAALGGEAGMGDLFDADVRDPIVQATYATCDDDLVTALATPTEAYTPPETLGQAVDGDFRLAVVGCVDGNSRCTSTAQAYVDRVRDGLVDVDRDGAPVLVIAGEQDVRHTPQEVACQVASMEEAGLTPDVCLDDEASHDDLVRRTITHALGWSGVGDAVDCPAATLPRCPT